MIYGNGRALTTAYDARMRATQWNIAGVLGYNYAYDNFNERTGRVTLAQSLSDTSLNRSYEYDQVGRLVISHSGAEADAHAYSGQWGTLNGPYSQGYDYDQWGNLTHRFGWGGEVQGGVAGQSSDLYYTYSNGRNQRDGFTYDAAGNLTNDTAQAFTYGATGQQASSTLTNLQQAYDGDGLRVRKSDNSTGVTYYLRSSVLGGQVVGQLVNVGGVWQWNQGYVYLGGQLLATQHYGVNFVHEDPVTKSKRVTDISGNVLSTVETDPWGADTTRSSNAAFQPRKFTSYERDANGSDDAMARRYNRQHTRFDQPDPYDGSYNLSNPQSFNRYAYVGNDPVNFVDPSGLDLDPITITVIGNIDSPVRGGTGGSLAGLGGRDGTIVDELLVEVGSGVDPGTGPQKTPEQQKCDDKLASIFGGKGALAAGNGFEPKESKYNGGYRGDTIGDNGRLYPGHLSQRAMHLYGGDGRLATTGVYIPTGASSIYANPQTLPEYRGGSFVAFYSSLNGLSNVSLITTHVANFTGNSSQTNAAGSVYIGNTGGRGATNAESPNYVHSHFELVQGRVVRGRSTTAMKHYSFADVFCK